MLALVFAKTSKCLTPSDARKRERNAYTLIVSIVEGWSSFNAFENSAQYRILSGKKSIIASFDSREVQWSQSSTSESMHFRAKQLGVKWHQTFKKAGTKKDFVYPLLNHCETQTVENFQMAPATVNWVCDLFWFCSDARLTAWCTISIHFEILLLRYRFNFFGF